MNASGNRPCAASQPPDIAGDPQPDNPGGRRIRKCSDPFDAEPEPLRFAHRQGEGLDRVEPEVLDEPHLGAELALVPHVLSGDGQDAVEDLGVGHGSTRGRPANACS